MRRGDETAGGAGLDDDERYILNSGCAGPMLFCLFLLWFQSAAAQIQSPSALAQQPAKRGFELSQQADLETAEKLLNSIQSTLP